MAHFCLLKANFQITLHIVRLSMSTCSSRQSLTDFIMRRHLASSAYIASVLEIEITFGISLIDKTNRLWVRFLTLKRQERRSHLTKLRVLLVMNYIDGTFKHNLQFRRRELQPTEQQFIAFHVVPTVTSHTVSALFDNSSRIN